MRARMKETSVLRRAAVVAAIASVCGARLCAQEIARLTRGAAPLAAPAAGAP